MGSPRAEFRAVGRAPTLVRRICLAAVTAALMGLVSGCVMGSSGPPHVSLSLVAPTDGATVYVRAIVVLGHVSPGDARVLVAGRTATVDRGTFRIRMQLPRHVNRIGILGSASGYRSASLATTVRVTRLISPSSRPATVSPPERRQLGPCACIGYLWRGGGVRSVSATWRVPRVAPRTVGLAGTWIGAESPGRFIQIGVNEGRLLSETDWRLGLSPAEVPPVWYAFWSDTAHGFHPVPLGSVQPGDLVRARLTLSGGRWWLRITDRHAALMVHLSTSEEAAAPSDQAEWLQEDVANSRTGGLLPYPRLTAIRFQDMRVNRGSPSDPSLTPSVSPRVNRGLILAPIRDDSFTVRP